MRKRTMNDSKILAASDEASPNIDLESLGLSEIAYLREATVDGVPGYSIHAANGVPIGFAPGEDAAIAAVLTNEMDVVPLH
jgi:hypothetical protein